MAIAAPTTVSLAIEVGIIDSDRHRRALPRGVARLSHNLTLSHSRYALRSFARSFQPLAALISTAFVGHVLGHVALAGVGISLTVGIDLDRRALARPVSLTRAAALRSLFVPQLFNSLTKLLNMPLLAVVTSSTAVATDVNDVLRSSAVLAVIVGLVQTLVLFALMETGVGLGAYGLAVDSVAYGPARAYLAVRVFGNLVGVVFFAFLGVFRGLQDTVSPLAATLLFTVSSVCLEYVFLCRLSLGPAGAAAAVVAAQCLGVALQVGLLARKHRVHFGTVLGANRRDGDGERPTDRQLVEKLAMCGILMLRTALVMLVYSSATSLVARSGSPVLSAAHQVGIECIDRFNDRSMDRALL